MNGCDSHGCGEGFFERPQTGTVAEDYLRPPGKWAPTLPRANPALPLPPTLAKAQKSLGTARPKSEYPLLVHTRWASNMLG